MRSSPEQTPLPQTDKPAFPYDPTPMTRPFPGPPQDCLDLINCYGTYNIQPTADTDDPYPAIAQGLARDAKLPKP